MTEKTRTRRDFLGTGLTCGVLVAGGRRLGGSRAWGASELGERQRVVAAIPSRAPAAPAKPRKLLIFELNVGYGGHRSIPTANLAFTLMGEKTGAFETVVSRDPAVFEPQSLKRFDAVFLNNTVGNLFEDPGLRQSLMDFVYGGGGLLGVHGTSVAFTRWPGAHEDWAEFGILLGARGANHRDSDEHVFVRLDDPGHPVNEPFGGRGFEYRDEFFRVHGPYSRDRVRVLLGIDTDKTDLNQGLARGNCERQDNDYALAWVRGYGRGRVFYCTIAHNPYVFWDPKMLEFYLAATQFGLGNLPAPTTPSAKVTPSIRAQERLGWRLGLGPAASEGGTLFEAIDRAAALGLLYVSGSRTQRLSPDISRPFDERLSDDERRQIRLKLDAAGVRLLTYRVRTMPSDERGRRKVFKFARRMGVEAIIAEPSPEALDSIQGLCTEFDVRLALSQGDKHPRELLRMCRGRDERIGVCLDTASLVGAGAPPVEVVRALGERLTIVSLNDLKASSAKGRSPAGDSEAGRIGPLLKEIHLLGLRPTMFEVEHPHGRTGRVPEVVRTIESFNQITVQLAM